MTPKLGPFGGPTFRAANSSNFCNLALSTRGPQTSTQRGKLRTTTSAGSFLVEVINLRETCTGEAHAHEARIAQIFGPTFGVAQTDIARPLRPHLRRFGAFRGPPRPHSWGFEAFRGLTKPQQNPKTRLACKITRPRGPGLIILINGSPQGLEPGQTLAASSM